MLRYQLVAAVTRKRSLDAIKRVVINYRLVLAVVNGILMFNFAYEYGVLEQEPQWSLSKADIADGTTRLAMAGPSAHAASCEVIYQCRNGFELKIAVKDITNVFCFVRLDK